MQKYNVLRADFHQETVDADGHRVSESRGHLIAQPPRSLRWEVTQPATQTLVTNGVDVWFYDPDLEQVTVSRLDQHVADAPLLVFASDAKSLLDRYNVRAEEAAGVWLFELRQRQGTESKSVDFERVDLKFVKEEIDSMAILDSLKQVTSVEFKRVEHPQGVAGSTFAFEIPPNAEIIRR